MRADTTGSTFDDNPSTVQRSVVHCWGPWFAPSGQKASLVPLATICTDVTTPTSVYDDDVDGATAAAADDNERAEEVEAGASPSEPAATTVAALPNVREYVLRRVLPVLCWRCFRFVPSASMRELYSLRRGDDDY